MTIQGKTGILMSAQAGTGGGGGSVSSGIAGTARVSLLQGTIMFAAGGTGSAGAIGSANVTAISVDNITNNGAAGGGGFNFSGTLVTDGGNIIVGSGGIRNPDAPSTGIIIAGASGSGNNGQSGNIFGTGIAGKYSPGFGGAGGGGVGVTSQTAGSGGNGWRGAGGGGGGGCANASTSSGAGGTGGNGYCVITCYG
jgi:hypothetical protein